MRLAVVLCALLGFASPARADSVAYTCTAAKNVTPILKTGACAGFVAHDANGKVVQRVDHGLFHSGTLLATPDGKTVAMLQSYPYATGKLDTMDALVFFRGGKRVATYSMADLIQRMKLVTRSVSHWSWLARDSYPALELGPTLTLHTSSQRTYVFDTASGKQTSADDSATWKTCDVLAYVTEKIAPSSSGIYTVPKPWIAKGPAFSSGLTFRAPKHLYVTDRTGFTLCLVPTKLGWEVKAVLDVMYNLLPG